MKKITYMYPQINGGRVSIAIRYEPKCPTEQTLEFAFAWSSPNDQFKRKTGRAIALGRLEHGKMHTILLKPGVHIKESVYDYMMALTSGAPSTEPVPKWARPKAVRKFDKCKLDTTCCRYVP